MSASIAVPRFRPALDSAALLRGATLFWFVVLVAGQCLFAVSIAMFYGLSAARGDFHTWHKRLLHGYIPGDHIGNAALIIHLGSAVLIMLSGALQFIPAVRRRAPKLHRWNGRLYILTAFSVSLAGAYLLLVRGTPTDLTQNIGTLMLAVVIMVCAAQALRFAMIRDFATHRRWALRLFVAVGAALFIRAAALLYILAAVGTTGFDVTVLQGPLVTSLSYTQYIVPLGVLEVYFWVQRGGGAGARAAMAVALAAITLVMGAGVAVAGAGIFLPEIKMALDPRPSIAEALAATIAASGIDPAVAQYRRLKVFAPTSYNFDEDELNTLGYDLIRTGKFPAAIRILALNTEVYPKSANTWDSLGEAYMDAGDKPDAIANYHASLAINPGNHNAVVMLGKMGSK